MMIEAGRTQLRESLRWLVTLQVRRKGYWAVFAGAFGHTYSTHL